VAENQLKVLSGFIRALPLSVGEGAWVFKKVSFRWLGMLLLLLRGNSCSMWHC